MADLCPECMTFTVVAYGMSDKVTPPAPLKRCTSCGVEVIDLVDDVPLAEVVELRPRGGDDGEWSNPGPAEGARADRSSGDRAGFPGAWDDEMGDFARSACLGEVVEVEEVADAPAETQEDER